MSKNINKFEENKNNIISILIDVFISIKNSNYNFSPNISKELRSSIDNLFKKYFGISSKDSFNSQTLWSKMQNNTKGAEFKCYIGIFQRSVPNTYSVSLMYHNMDADSDMSDDSLVDLVFEVIELPNNEFKIKTYSFQFQGE